MPAVASKLLNDVDRTRRLLNVPSHYWAGAVFASTLVYYIGQPVVARCLGNNQSHQNNNKQHESKNKHVAENNNQQLYTSATNSRDVENCETIGAEQTTTAAGTDTGKGKKNTVVYKLAGKIPAFNLEFIFQFIRLMRIMVPSLFCREMGLLTGHTISLFLRTFLSIYVANMEGAIVKYIVRKDAKNFTRMLVKWFTVALPATFINSMIRYLESKLALAFRTRLVEHSYRLYFNNQTYYRTTVLDGRLDNCAQRLTDDIETVASVVARLYSQITKPLFDLLLIGVALARLTISAKASLIHGPALCISVVGLTGYILRAVSPRFGQLVAEEAEKKGHLRYVHARLIANAEEIAFYGGHRVELNHLRSAYRALGAHLEKMFGIKLWFVMLEQFLMKYVWSGAGMVVVSLPILLANVQSTYQDGGISDRTQYFTTAKNLLHSASDAVERLMSSYKEIVELAGHTARVENMFSVFEDAAQGKYKKTLVDNRRSDANQSFLEFVDGQPVAKGKIIDTSTESSEIILKNVPIVTPNCDVVCPALSLTLRPGTHLLITGPNGCGKSSLFRILSGLWPVYSGELHVPEKSMFYIPQRPYLVIGNLRDQIIYPDTYSDMINRQVTEAQLTDIMRQVHLEHIVKRDTYEAVKDWTDILSGGEKQRMAMARLFYHRPKFALLDECTSAVSIDVESSIYQAAIDLGITLLTITHRPTLWKFHTHILQFDGTGSWEFNRLDATHRLDLKKEKHDLLTKPKTDERDRRLKELARLLGEDVES